MTFMSSDVDSAVPHGLFPMAGSLAGLEKGWADKSLGASNR